MSFLAGAGGGAASLEDTLQAMAMEDFRNRQLAETTRSNQANEGLSLQRIMESAADRRAREAETALYHREMDRNRDENTTLRRVALRPIGAEVDPGDVSTEQRLGVPTGNYQEQPHGREPGFTGPLTEEDTAKPSTFKWLGTQDQITQAAQAAKERQQGGTLEETPAGVVRVLPDNSVQPVYGPDGQPLRKFHPPPQPDRVLVQTDQGFIPRGELTRRLGAGEHFEGPLPAMTRQRMYSARQVSSHIQDTLDEVDEADRRGLIGPLEGRWGEFMRGSIGSTGNPDDDELLNQLRTDLKLMGSGTVMTHFGARGGQQLIEGFNKEVLNSGKMSRSALRGSLHSLGNWLGTYGTNPATGQAPGQTPRAPSAPGGPDLYQEYLDRTRRP